MADISPGQYPTTPSLQAVNFRVVTPTITSETNSGKIRRVGFGHSYYTFEAQYPSLTASQLGEVTGFLATAMGPLFSFEIVLPELSYSKAPITTANGKVTTGTVAVGQRWANITGVGVNNTLILKAGDFIRFGAASKVYMVTQDVTTSGSGTANIQFSGSAVSSVTAGTPIWTNGVPFTVIATESEQSFESSYGGMSTLAVTMREVW
jgi:hypothetical protein